jgi:hypothetical protein
VRLRGRKGWTVLERQEKSKGKESARRSERYGTDERRKSMERVWSEGVVAREEGRERERYYIGKKRGWIFLCNLPERFKNPGDSAIYLALCYAEPRQRKIDGVTASTTNQPPLRLSRSNRVPSSSSAQCKPLSLSLALSRARAPAPALFHLPFSHSFDHPFHSQ